jgi:hypothetical protein
MGGRSEWVSPGKKRQVAIGEILDQQGAEDFGEHVGLYHSRLAGGQVIEIKQALKAFEGYFDLPAEAVDFKCLMAAEFIVFKVGQQDDVLGSLKRTRVDASAFASSI